MISKSVRSFFLALSMGGAALLFQGCPTTDPCNATPSPKSSKSARSNIEPRYEFQRPDLAGATRAEKGRETFAAVSTKLQPERLALVATQDTPYSFQKFPNSSFGKFIVQGTVAFAPGKGLIDNASAAGFEFDQPKFAGGARNLYFTAVTNPGISGYTAKASDFTGAFLSVTMNFPNTPELDLRLEQSTTQLVFSARATPADQSAGGWTQVYAANTPPDPAAFNLFLGMRQVKKGAIAYFSNIALDGDAIGGYAEFVVMRALDTSVQSIRAAQAKITAAMPDLSGALTDLDAAIAASNSVQEKIDTGLVDFAFQSPAGAILGLKGVRSSLKDLTAARAVVATLDAKKAAAQVKKLDSIAGAALAIEANMIGWKAPNLKAMPDIFSLHIP